MPGRHVWFVLAGLFARSAAKLFSFERSSGRSPLQGRSTIRSQFRGASKIGDATAGSSCPYNSNPIGGNGAVLQFEANLQPATTITFATAGWNSPYNSKPIGALGRFTVRSQITSDDDHRRYSRLNSPTIRTQITGIAGFCEARRPAGEIIGSGLAALQPGPIANFIYSAYSGDEGIYEFSGKRRQAEPPVLPWGGNTKSLRGAGGGASQAIGERGGRVVQTFPPYRPPTTAAVFF